MEKIKHRIAGEILCGGPSLKVVLERYQKWINDEEGGERADLRNANLWNADLRNDSLSDADLRNAENGKLPVSFGPVGKEQRTGYAIWDDEKKYSMVRLGCFYGTEKEAVTAVVKKYGSRSGYAMMVRAACKVAKERKILNPTEAR